MELSDFCYLPQEMKGSSLKELQKLLEASSKMLDENLKLGSPNKFTGDPAWNDVQRHLEELKEKISSRLIWMECLRLDDVLLQ